MSGRGSKLTGRMDRPSGVLSWTITYPVNWPKQQLTLNVTSKPGAGRGTLGPPSLCISTHGREIRFLFFLGTPHTPTPQDQDWPLGIKNSIPDTELTSLKSGFPMCPMAEWEAKHHLTPFILLYMKPPSALSAKIFTSFFCRLNTIFTSASVLSFLSKERNCRQHVSPVLRCL